MRRNEREGLIARIRHLRRVAAAEDARSATTTPSADTGRVQGLEVRVAHLEQLLEGLQDSVYRESERQSRRIAELEARTQPGAIGEALSKDARERGL
jgi:uncharacterized coiled-coil protein SlyX